MSHPWLKACERVGPGVELDAKPLVGGPGRITIGDRFRLASLPVESHMITGPNGALAIGDDVAIGHGAAIAAYERVTIGDSVRIGPFVVIMDTDWHAPGDRAERHDTLPIVIGAGARIGSRVTILRGAHVGDGAVIDAGSVVSGEIPARSHAAGVPAIPKDVGGEHGAADARVPLIVMRALSLAAPPEMDHGRRELPQWDSLGMLKVLLALEDAFGISLAEDEVARAATIAELTAIVTRAVVR